MTQYRIPMAVCVAVGKVIKGSHADVERQFFIAGAPGPPPNTNLANKCKTWLASLSHSTEVDSLSVLGRLIEEFMDVSPQDEDEAYAWNVDRSDLVAALEKHGLRYYQGGRVLPLGQPLPVEEGQAAWTGKPKSVDELLGVLVRGLPRAIHPLLYRRQGAHALSFGSEYDLQDMLHALLRPWVADIRPEEFTPSYAGSSTRMDFLLPAHGTVIEVKRVRNRDHAKNISKELILDFEHYKRHPQCSCLWCVIYDPEKLIANPTGFSNDLSGKRTSPDGDLEIKVLIVS